MYSLLFIFPIVLYFITKRKPDVIKSKKLFIIVMTLVLSTVSGLRGLGTGIDTYNYYMNFETIQNTSWFMLISNITDYLQGANVTDPGFFVFVKIIQIFFSSFYIFNFFVALLVTSAIGVLIFNGVEKISGYVLSYSYYISLLYWNIPNNLTRQSIAIALMIFSIFLILRKRKILAVLLMLFAILCHRSAFLGVIPILLLYVKNTKWAFLSIILLTPLLFLLGQEFVNILVLLSDSERYLHYMDSETTARPLAYMLEMFLFYLMGIGKWKKKYVMNDIQRVSYTSFALSVAFVSMLWVDSDLLRIGMYFSIFGVVYIPYCVYHFKKHLWVVYIIVMTLFVGRSILRPENYQFYWEQYELSDRYRYYE